MLLDLLTKCRVQFFWVVVVAVSTNLQGTQQNMVTTLKGLHKLKLVAFQT